MVSKLNSIKVILSSLLLSAIIFFAITNSASAAILVFGNSTIGPTIDTNNSNVIDGSQFTMGSANGIVANMSVYVSNVNAAPNNKYQLAIYTNNSNGKPGSLVAKSTTGTLINNSWNTLPVNIRLKANTKYWLMYNTNGLNANSNNLRVKTGGKSAWTNRTVAFGTWPTIFGTPSGDSYSYSIYATVSTTDTVVPIATPTPTNIPTPTPTQVPTPTPTKIPTPTTSNPSPTASNPTPTSANPSPTPPCSITPTSPNMITLSVNVLETNTYKIWSRIMGSSDSVNSYYLQVDNNCPVNVGDLAGLPSNVWTWVDYKDGATDNKITVPLTAGAHTIKMIEKEGGIKIDKIIALSDLNCVPTEFGDNCLVVPTPTTAVATPTSAPVVTPTLAPTTAPGASRCPAFPAFPDASCTGVPPGVTLRDCSISLTANNAVYDGCRFTGGVDLLATGITIKNSKILGIISTGGDYSIKNLTMVDVEIDGRDSDKDATNALIGYSCTRCNVHSAGKGFTGSNFTVIDSYVHDLYGETSCAKYPSDCISHNEPVLGSDGNIVIRHSNLVGNFSSSSSGGGMSAAVALYTHGDFWGPMDNVLMEQTRLETQEAVFCMYGGNSTTRAATNIRLLNNAFYINPSNGTCGTGGPIVGWKQGGGNVWSGNMMLQSTGATTALPEPASSPYN